MSSRSRNLLIGALTGAALLLGGCVTAKAPARYYRLGLPPLLPALPAPGSETSGRLLIGPVEVAEYLDRNQLITGVGPNRLEINELDQWAGSLAGQIEQVILHHLANRLGRDAVLPYPAEADRDTDRRLRIRVLALDAGPDARARLTLFWQVSGGGRDDRHGLESLEQALEGPGMDATVAAYDDLLEQAAARIVQRLGKGR